MHQIGRDDAPSGLGICVSQVFSRYGLGWSGVGLCQYRLYDL